MDDMLNTMYEAPGIGLAAVQIGILKRLIVIDISNNQKNPLFIVNPKIIFKSKNTSTHEEIVLSLPDFAEIERPSEVLRYLDYNGKRKTKARYYSLYQHEVDHLDGILFIDYLSKLKNAVIQNLI